MAVISTLEAFPPGKPLIIKYNQPNRESMAGSPLGLLISA